MSVAEPCQTLYINNINEKIKKDVLKKLLYMIFSQYGRVKHITACKGIKLRGQAWLAFEDVGAAIKAKSGKDGFMFYDKPLRISFAKTNSKEVARLPGSGKSAKRNRAQQEAGDSEDERPTKGAKLNVAADAASASSRTTAADSGSNVIGNTSVPHKILVAQNLPPDCGDAMLLVLFQSCAGFKEVRMAPGARGIAFVEFENETQAGMALRQMNGYQISATHSMLVTYSN